jgi:threonine dehydrogenase-like Zn-dependent dehydrogenase
MAHDDDISHANASELTPKLATAFWSAKGKGYLQTETLTPLKDHEALVVTHFTGLSKGTESLVFDGRVPDSEHQRMRAPFQQGEFGGEVKYGYCNVGVVEQGPPDWVGQAVFCLYPHQDRYVVTTDALRRLPDGLPLGRAVLAANMETAVNGIADAGLDPAVTTTGPQTVTIIGAGVVGALMAHLAQGHGHLVEVVDIDPLKQPILEELGLSMVLPKDASAERSVVIHTSASEAGLRLALGLAGMEGLIVEMSWFGTTQPSLPLGEAFHAKRLTLRSSQVGQIAPSRRDTWNHASRFDYALEQLKDPRLDALITHESGFAELPQVMATLPQSMGVMCHRIRYPK